LKIREIATPVCALARNDMVFRHANVPFVLPDKGDILFALQAENPSGVFDADFVIGFPA